MKRAFINHPMIAGGSVIGMRYCVGDMIVQASTMDNQPGQSRALPASSVHYPARETSLVDWALGKCGDAAISVSSFAERVDVGRVMGFGMFGFIYGAAPGYLVYRVLYPRIALFAKRPLLQALVDVYAQCTFVYFPLFYVAQEGINMRSQVAAGKMAVTKVVENAIDKWSGNFWGDVKLLSMVWIPLHYVNFRFLPLHQRMPFMAIAGVLWSGVLSFERGAPSPARQAREHTKV